MRRSIEVNQQLHIKASYKLIGVTDMLMIIVSLPIGYLLSTMVFPLFQIVMIVLVPLLTFYLFMPSADIWGKKNYEAYYIILTSDKRVYQAL